MNLDGIKKLDIPKSPGVYQFRDKDGAIIYVGKAADLRVRVFSYWRKSAGHSPAKYSMMKRIDKISWIETESEIEALLLEANLIKKIQPQYNVVMRDDKRYVYIKIAVEDEIPGVFITRKIDKSGKYFGPFTGVEAVKQTLKAIRKIWPYCAARKRQNLPAGKAGKPCFYYQINRCIGICAGIVSKKEYMEKVIKPIILFLEGKKNAVIGNLKLEIKNLEKKLKSYKSESEKFYKIQEEINLLKFQLWNIEKVLEHIKILSVADKYENDVVELAKILGLPKVPERIEGYDISNIFGKEATGSMVVFSGGEPNKSEYRKFKIKLKHPFVAETRQCLVPADGKRGDTQMLREILERRFKHIKETKSPIGDLVSCGWQSPDLIIIDGGKAQLNVASRILKKFKFDIPVIAISKGLGLRSAGAPDKLFFPGEKKPLELPLASPALHLIKRVRDEAHRFAIGYHRKLRRKRMF